MLRPTRPQLPLAAMRGIIPKACAAVALLALGVIFLSCGGGEPSLGTQEAPNLAGSWELIAVSNNGSITGIELALKEGQVLDNGIEVPSGQIAATNTQINFVSLTSVSQNLNIMGFGGSCAATPTSPNSLGPGAVTTIGSPVTFTFTANGNVFNATAGLGADGQSLVNGTYTAQTGNTCSDNGGTITGSVVSKLAGTYMGQMCPLSSPSSSCENSQNLTDTATATASESSSGTLSLTLVYSAGPDSGTTITLTGPVTGNAFTLQGTYQGQTITYYGYYEQIYNSSLQVNIPSLYLVNATDTSVPVGILGVPQTQ
jgi:hypothetical protein